MSSGEQYLATVQQYYSRKEVNSRHLVAFAPIEYTGKHYDFDRQEWRPVKALDRLPYNLITLCYTDEEGDANKVIVTCQDSYRLDNTNASHEELLAQKQWREQILLDQQEALFDYTDGNVVYHAKPCWFKSDIVPGVICGGRRECPNINGFGYLFYESSKFYQYGELLEKVAAEQLEQENIHRQQLAERKKEEENTIEEWKKKLPVYTMRKSGFGSEKYKFYDIRPFYQSIVRENREITREYIESVCSGWEDPPKLDKLNDMQLALLYATCSDKFGVKCAYGSKELQIGDAGMQNIPNSAEFLFDLRVYGASYAEYYCGDVETSIPMEELVDNDGVKYFGFADITYDNPMWFSVSGGHHRIQSNGEKITYKVGFLAIEERTILHKFNLWAISWLNDKVLMLGHITVNNLVLEKDEYELDNTENYVIQEDGCSIM